MKTLEKILIKLCGKTKGLDFNMWDWDSVSLGEKLYRHEVLSQPAIYAMQFFSKIGEYLEQVDPSEKWKRSTGDVLNEHRNLH